jgi:hypothetical protein
MAMYGLSRVRTELHFVVLPSPAPDPVQLDCKFPGHRDLGDFSPPPHGQVKKLAAPLGMAAHRNLGRFHQQKPQQSVALLADMSESSPIPLDSPMEPAHIAGDLFWALETFRFGRNSNAKAVGG